MTHSVRLGPWLLLGKHVDCAQVGPAITTTIHPPLDQVPVPTGGEPQAHRDCVGHRSLVCLESKVMRPSLTLATGLSHPKLVLGTIPFSSIAYRDGDKSHA